MEANLEGRFKRGGSKGSGRCKRRGILPPTGLAQNTEMEKNYDRYCWSCLFGTCQVRVRFEPEQDYLLLYQKDSNSECFASVTGADPEKYGYDVLTSDLDVLNLQEDKFFIIDLECWVHSVGVIPCRWYSLWMYFEMLGYMFVNNQAMKKARKPQIYPGSKLCVSEWPMQKILGLQHS